IYNEQKRIDRIVDVVELLQKDNLKFHWYIVGDGPDLLWLKKKVEEKSLHDFITFLGFKRNPYPYMKNADYFILTSDYEAQGLVLSEALICGTPVVSSNFGAAKEFVNKDNGFLVEKNV